jgi:two-component system, OmpR family, sensor kinase
MRRLATGDETDGGTHGRSTTSRGRWSARAEGSGLARTIRVRVLASFVMLIALSAALSSLAIRQVLTIRLEDRIDEELTQETLEINRLLVDGRDPRTGQPFASVEAVFDVFFSRNVPSPEEALVAVVDGEIYRSALMRFPLDQVPSAMLERLAAASVGEGAGNAATGTIESSAGPAYFRVLPIELGSDRGVFGIVILPVSQFEEIGGLQLYGTAVVTGVLLLASAFAWWAIGRVLTPVRLLTDTARMISESDLRGRVPVQGDDEAAGMARTFNAMLDRLEGVFQAEREFIRDTGHELRVPLQICLGNLALIEDGLLDDDPEERAKTIAVTASELERMGRIVEDLQVLADTERPDFLQPEPVDLPLFTEELAAKARSLAPRRWTVDNVAEGVLVADRQRLTEAMMNLAHNAVQHTAPEDTLALGTLGDGSEVRLWVRDSGTGITVSDQLRIWGRMRRGAQSYRRYRGSGLGLAIVKRIAEAHGGRVELHSEPGAGSTFTIMVPRRAGEEVRPCPGS